MSKITIFRYVKPFLIPHSSFLIFKASFCYQKLDFDSFFGKHFFMLRHDIRLIARTMQISCHIGNVKKTFPEIFNAFLEQLVIIGLEMNFAAVTQKILILCELSRVCKTVFFMFFLRPWVAEINVNSVNRILLIQYFIYFFNIVCRQ